MSYANHVGVCAWCELQFQLYNRNQLGAVRRGLRVFCGPKCRTAYSNEQASTRLLRGPCLTCGKMFRTRRPEKRYCSMACYTSSPHLAANLRSYNDATRIPRGNCLNCGQEIVNRRARRKFCGDRCRRVFYATRFDRWVADPQSLALPQCYDEFLGQEELPCLIEGCDWVGQQLASHCNHVHGITADQLKELAGFNAKTGLVPPDMREAMSQRMRQRIEAGAIIPGRHAFTAADRAGRNTPRLEGKEHLLKAQAILRTSESERPPKPCRTCGKEVPQGVTGVQYYCSTPCRSAWYNRKGYADLNCSYCGQSFPADRAQVRRAQTAQKVCCSIECRNRMNMIGCLAARGIRIDDSVFAAD